MKNLYQVFSILLFIIFFSGCGVSKLSQSALNGNLNGVKQAIKMEMMLMMAVLDICKLV
jgi:hypothetical protein